MTLLATVALMPLNYVEAQNATRPMIAEHLTDAAKQKISDLRAQNPELGALADRMQNLNATQAMGELEALLGFAETMAGALKNLQGNMTAAR